ncbi:MAG TPA: hypothetical protein VJK05_02475 [archaeon]|nr:hypothetical protein [archaeon]
MLAIFFFVLIFKVFTLFSGFPSTDYSSHMASTVFLERYGFHGVVENLYNGFVLFQLYPPGFFFFELLLFKLTNNIVLSFLISIAIMFSGAIILFFFIGKELKLKVEEKPFLFLFAFTSFPIITNFFFGRLQEILSWILFLAGILILIHYKEKKLETKFFISFTFLLSIFILIYPKILILFFINLLGFFLIKNKKDKLIITATVFLSLLLTSFWWVPSILNFQNLSLPEYNFFLLYYLKNPSIILTNIIPFIYFTGYLFFSIFAGWKFFQYRKDSHLQPILLFSFLCFSFAILLIPLMKYIDPFSISFFFLINTLILFVKEKNFIEKNSFKLFIFVSITLSLIALIGLPFFTRDALSPPFKLLEETDSRFAVISDNFQLNLDLYAYSAIFYDLSTPFGWKTELQSKESEALMHSLSPLCKANSCSELKSAFKKINAEEIISNDACCNSLTQCNFTIKKQIQNWCLVSVK